MFSIETLQFEELLRLVALHAQTPMGIDLIAEIAPHTSPLELQRDLDLLNEARKLGEEEITWSFSDLKDLSAHLAYLRVKDSALEPTVLLEFSRTISQALSAKAAIGGGKAFAPELWNIVEPLPKALETVAEIIKKKILPSGEISDDASTELRRIRRELNTQRANITKTLEKLMRAKPDAVQDEIVTVRNDRFVIPVKSGFGGKIKGVAHGASSSGATVFVEPLDSIEANNELQTLKVKETAEIARILFSLADALRENVPQLEALIEAIALLDLVRAKFRFAQKFSAVVPEINSEYSLEFTDARHPVLEENLREKSAEVVPVSFSLNAKNSVMIISGANAGGKTVVLKTAGLLALMAVSGLAVPAKRARVPFYASILADIGDHQSLAANLSTFSSHISNIAEMMRELHTPALVLLDEVGTGTDPDEGSALGVAAVDYFRNAGAQVIASTHYKGLKIYAANDDDVINASVEFDEKTLVPTYHLIQGLAGASSGIEIAKRFGIRDDVIDAARKNLDSASRVSEDYLQKLQTETKLAEDLRRALEEEREATAQRYAKLDVEFRKREQTRKREFEGVLTNAIDDFEKKSRTFLKSVDDKKERKKFEKELAANRAELKRQAFARVAERASTFKNEPEQVSVENTPKETEKTKTESPPVDAELKAGSNVRLKTMGSEGKVDKIDGERAEVLIGAMRMRVPIDDLELLSNLSKSEESIGQKLKRSAKSSPLELAATDADSELNLIGQTAFDAQMEVERYLDQAYMAHLPRVRIIHGFGTGALKNAVHQTLKSNPHVSSYGFAAQNEGGNGATIVELKI
ncbi:MAG: endonuclease MutS2 [Pyrinomonadaceae bacterium]